MDYLDLQDNLIAPRADLHDYKTRATDGAIVITDNYFAGKLAFSTYQGIDIDEVVAYHKARLCDVAFQLHAPGLVWFFDAAGTLEYKKRDVQVSSDLLVEEECDADDQLLRGTAYAYQDGEIRYAAEFDESQHYYSCTDFSNGDTIPFEEVRHFFAAYPAAKS
jgi:thymidylate kinase